MAKFVPYTLSTSDEKDLVSGSTRAKQYGCIVTNKDKNKKHNATWRIRETQTSLKKDVMQIIFPDGFDFSANFSDGDLVHVSSDAFSASGRVISFDWRSDIVKEDTALAYDEAATGRPAPPKRVKTARKDGEDDEESEEDRSEESGTPSAKEALPVAQATPADAALEQATLNNQASALTNTYAQARALANNPPEGVDPQFTAAMKYVLDSEISAKPTGESWTAAHSQALREAAGLLLGNVSNPELQIFVRSYDAAMAVDITAENSGERFGITRTGAKALSAFVNANKDTAPQRGDAQYFLRDASNSDLKLVQQDPKSVLASAWALIFALRVRFRRGEVLGSIAASPSMRYPWPAERDTRNFSDSPAKDASVGPRLTLRVWTQADRDDKFDLGKSAVVLTFEADSSSFAKQIKELPSILRLRTATRSREEAVRGKK